MKTNRFSLFLHIFLVLGSIFSPAPPAEDPNETQMVFTDRHKDSGPPPPAVPLFLEDVKDQLYLPSIPFDDRYVLDLYNFDKHIKNIDFEQNPEISYYCAKSLFDSFGLRGYLTPMLRTPDVFFCPKLRQTCCVPNDFDQLDSLWRQKYRNYIRYHQAYFRYYTITLLEQHQAVRRAAESVVENAQSDTCLKIAQRLLATSVTDSLIQTSRELLDRFLDFDYKLKRGFLCLLCDFENHRDFDFDTRLLDLNHEVCEQMVDYSLEFYHHFNNFVYKYINSANFVAYCFDELDPRQSGQIKRDQPINFLEVDNNMSVENCARAKRNGYNVFVNCLGFCSRYNMWYPAGPLYRDIDLLGNIFENIKTKIIKDELKYVVGAPQKPKDTKLFESKFDKYNIFDKWEFVFSDRTGVLFENFVDIEYEDL